MRRVGTASRPGLSIDELVSTFDAVGVTRRDLPEEVRDGVIERDNFRCLYCQMAYSREELEVDHVKAWHYEHKHEWSNLFAACIACNRSKGKKSVLQWCVGKYGEGHGRIEAFRIGAEILLRNVYRRVG